MSDKRYNIHDDLEERAKLWEEGKPDLLSDSNLWHAVRYGQSKTAKQMQLSDRAQEYINTSFTENEEDYLGTGDLKDKCRGCLVTYRSSNLLICIGCSRELCGGCASDLERNEHGDPRCYCGGIFV